MQRHFKTAAIAAAVLSTFNVYAADETVGPEVVVTATRQPQRVDELLADVTVISRDEIEQAGATVSLTELIGRQAGVQFTSNGGPGTNSGVLIRGANDGHTLVLVDGQRVNSATLGSTSLSRIPVAQIDHIEILRGPASALYGSEAIGGVVQIFTKRGEGAAQWFVEAGAGTYGTTDANAGVSGGGNGWRYSVSADRFLTDGFGAIHNKTNTAYNSDKDGYSDDSLSGTVSYSPVKGHEYGITVFRSDGSNRYDGGYLTSAASDYKTDNSVVSYAMWARDRVLSAWTSTLRAGHGTDDSTNYNNGNPTSAFRTDQNQLSWQNDIALSLGTAMLALERTDQKVETSTAYSVTQRRINAVLLGWNGNIGEHRLQVNLRRDSNSQFGNRTTGVLAYGYQFTSMWRAGLSAGTAFKAPTFNDLYYPSSIYGAGNPNLLPETSRAGEASVHYEDGNTAIGLTYYQNRIKNLIQWAPVPPSTIFYTPQNVATAELKGLTLAYDGRPNDYALHPSLDKLDARDTATDLQLLRRARTTGNISAGRDFGKWKLSVEVQAVGPRYSDVANTEHLGGYALANLHGAYALTNEWSLFARANNLFDKRYEQVADYSTAGAAVFAGIRYTSK